LEQATRQTDHLETPAHRMNTSRVIALSSAAAFGTQVAFALITLRLFSPQEVGEFSVISQIGFFWMTLALAQSQLGLLANQHLPAHIAAQHAWRASALRGLALLPIAALAVWFSQLSLWPALLWALLLAFCQMGWGLAQSFTLRVGSAWQQAAVRVLPPATAAATALTAALAGATFGWHGPTLLLSALLGYAVGAAWLVPALRTHTINGAEITAAPSSNTQSDPRSAALRMAHTLVDALLATAIVVVWQRLYGAEETGYMSALLRVLGFVPAVVHMAWAQVALARATNYNEQTHLTNPWWIGLGGFASVVALGALCAIALYNGWLDERWSGVWPYIAPLVLWQGSACLSAAFAHRPFQTQSAKAYSWACMGLAAAQAVAVLLPLGLGEPLDATSHISAFAWVSGLGLLGLTGWMARLR
jgi:O-antigen/teichoic acid export membrane protein